MWKSWITRKIAIYHIIIRNYVVFSFTKEDLTRIFKIFLFNYFYQHSKQNLMYINIVFDGLLDISTAIRILLQKDTSMSLNNKLLLRSPWKVKWCLSFLSLYNSCTTKTKKNYFQSCLPQNTTFMLSRDSLFSLQILCNTNQKM